MRATKKTNAWLREYYQHIDGMNTEGYMAMFAEDARMVFANADPIEGRDGIRQALTALLDSVGGIRHTLHDVWQEEHGPVIFECDVLYTRKDGKEVSVRAAAFFVIGDDGLCREQRITVDLSPVFAG